MAEQTLFGSYNPQLIQQAIEAERERGLLEQAKLTPQQIINLGAARSGQQMGQALGGVVNTLFGLPSVQDPRLQQAQLGQQAYQEALQASGNDASSPAFFKQLSSSAARLGVPTLAQQAAQQAARLESEQALRVQRLASAQASLREKPVADGSKEYQKYKELKALGMSDPEARNAAYGIKPAAAGEEGPKVGFSKTGAYTNQFGETIPASEMTKQRAGFQSAEDLLNKLNKITEEDIKQAESFIDYTQGETRKTIGGKFASKTLDAQTKIAAGQLLQQIEALPPGSASDADMRAASRSFPGYGDATALRNWVNRTKAELNESLSRQSETYGFSRKVNATSSVGISKQKSKSSAKPVGLSDAEWNAMTPAEKELFK
jgi:hypothetical protein